MYAILSLLAQIWVFGAIFTFITSLNELRDVRKVHQLRGNRYGTLFWILAVVATFTCWPYAIWKIARS